MGSNLGTLTLDLVCKIGGFTGPMDKAARNSRKNSKSITDDSKSIGQSLISFVKSPFGIATGAIAAATTATIAFTKSSLSAADGIGKVAATAGLTTDTIQEMRHAASLSGISFDELDNSMQQFNKRVGELRAGTGSLYTYLNKVDKALLNQVKSASSTDDALDMIFKSMKNISSSSDKAALSAAAFGRSGQRISIMADDYERLRKEARDLGLVIDSDLIKNAEIINDKFDTMSRIVKTQLTTAILELGPALQKIADKLLDVAPGINWLLGGEKRSNAKLEEMNAITDELQDMNKLLNEQRGIQTRLLMLKSKGSWYDPNELEQVNNNIESIIESTKELVKKDTPKSANNTTTNTATGIVNDSSWSDLGDVLKSTSDTNKQRLEIIKQSNAAIAAENNRQLQEDIARDAAYRQLVEEADIAELNNKYTGVELELKLHEHKFEKLKELYTEGSQELTEIERLQTEERKKIMADAAEYESGIRNQTVSSVAAAFGMMADLAGQYAGEQKAIYKALFVASKAFALADAIINLNVAISKATASAPPPYNIPAIAAAAIQGAIPIAGIVATTIAGLAHDGIDSIPETGTWLLKKGERVTTAETSRKLDNTLSRLNNNYSSTTNNNQMGNNKTVEFHTHVNVTGNFIGNNAAMRDLSREINKHNQRELTRLGAVI